jgi:hypothetical protein
MRRTNRALAILALCLALVGMTTAVAAAAQPTLPLSKTNTTGCYATCRPERPSGPRPRRSWSAPWSATFPSFLRSTAWPLSRLRGPDTAVPDRDVNVLASLLLGLIGGLAGGGAVIAGGTSRNP